MPDSLLCMEEKPPGHRLPGINTRPGLTSEYRGLSLQVKGGLRHGGTL
jgi:hypothetical protein